MNFTVLKKFILSELEEKISGAYNYHSVAHTIDVLESAQAIAKDLNVTSDDYLLLRTAALLHETGMMSVYENHEEASVLFMKEMLPDYGYTSHQIKAIEKLIIATKMPHQPSNLLESIMCDADLDYLGREDYFIISHRLRLEWIHKNNYPESLSHWYQDQCNFLQKHQYFTKVAKAKRDMGKLHNLKLVTELIQNNTQKNL